MHVPDVRKKGAGILRDRPNIQWNKDREEKGLEYLYRLTVKINGTKAEVWDESLSWIAPGSSKKNGFEPFFSCSSEEQLRSEITVDFSKESNHIKQFSLHRSYSILHQIESLPVDTEIKEPAGWILSTLQKIFVFEPIPSHMRSFSPISDRLLADGSNLSGVLAGFEGARKEEIEASLTRSMRDIPQQGVRRIWTEPVGKFQTDAMLYCEESWDETSAHEIDARGMSDGTLRYLSIVTALLTREPGSLLVIEEVDNGLHPSRIHILLDTLQKLGSPGGLGRMVTDRSMDHALQEKLR